MGGLPGHPSFEPILANYYEEAVVYIECSRGHKSAVMLQSQKFEILLESAVNALLAGYTIEAASSLSSAYERFLEFSIKVFCKKHSISKDALEETFKQVSKQSERQIGGLGSTPFPRTVIKRLGMYRDCQALCTPFIGTSIATCGKYCAKYVRHKKGTIKDCFT